MITKTEALKLALKVLEELTDDEQTCEALRRGDAAIITIKEVLQGSQDTCSLAQPEQPKRQPLTDEQIDAILKTVTTNTPFCWRVFARAIEAKLKD